MNHSENLGNLSLDFTNVTNAIEAIDFANWVRNTDFETTPEIAAAMGLKNFKGATARQYHLGPRHVDLRLDCDRAIVLDVESIEANVRPDGSLQYLLLRTFPSVAQSVAETAKALSETWNLHTFEEVPDENEEQLLQRTPVKLDAVAELEKWHVHPPDSVPSFFAQSDPDVMPGIWFLRVVINSHSVEPSTFQLSTQIFWRDKAFDNQRRHKKISHG